MTPAAVGVIAATATVALLLLEALSTFVPLFAPVTSGRVTIRALPANRAAALSLVVHSGEAAIRAQWSADGEPVTAG